MRFRPLERPNDLDQLESLLAIIGETDGHPAIGEHKYLTLLGPDTGDVEISLVGEEEPGVINTFVAIAAHSDGTYAMELAFHPLHRHPGLMRRTIDVGVGRVAETGGDRVRAWATRPEVVRALLEGGFEPERELLQLRRRLDRVIPPESRDGVEVRGFRPGKDDHAWLELNNRAFAGHPENGRWTIEILQHRIGRPWFRAEDFLLAEKGDRLIGFCWTKPHDEKVGEIYVIAVDPALTGAGLGTFLLGHGLQHLARSGSREVMLYVDSDNREALGLYQRMGFRLDHIDRSFLKEV